MTNELFNKISELNIYLLRFSDGTTYVGELDIDDSSEEIYDTMNLHNPFKLIENTGDADMLFYLSDLEDLVSEYESSLEVFVSNLCWIRPASFAIKKAYFDMITMKKLKTLEGLNNTQVTLSDRIQWPWLN